MSSVESRLDKMLYDDNGQRFLISWQYSTSGKPENVQILAAVRDLAGRIGAQPQQIIRGRVDPESTNAADALGQDAQSKVRYVELAGISTADPVARKALQNWANQQTATCSDQRINVYEKLSDSGDNDSGLVPAGAEFLLSVSMTVPDEADFTAWYEEEHIPLLLQVPGWLRSARYRKLAGTLPDFLALHYLATPEVFTRPEYRAARTPWRERIAASRTDYARFIYQLQATSDA